ncbi:MAG: T4 RnlA family RNA ligase [Bacteroidales bacterium]|nr:T4 RnlA family RNA ligase [Bacteroidales bacterium]
MNFDLKVLEKYVQDKNICCEKHPSEELYLYGYALNSETKWDEISVHCRGIILNEFGDVVERPFPKFWTYRQYLSKNTVLLSENKVLKIPKCKFRILEKIDGTMVTLYWINDKPYLATQRSFTNIKAVEATKLLYGKYQHLFDKFDKNYTYVFEAIYPETKVLIDYGQRRELVLIGMIDKSTGVQKSLPDVGFPLCKDYTDEFGHINNFDDLVNLDLPNQEGFVIHFEDGQMMKLKFPWYKEAHKLLDFFVKKDQISMIKRAKLTEILKKNVHPISTIDIWTALKAGDDNLFTIKQNIPDFYYLMGLDYWLTQQAERILSEYKLKKSWDLVKPEHSIEYFDFDERFEQSHIYETVVWKWEDRYIKHFK